MLHLLSDLREAAGRQLRDLRVELLGRDDGLAAVLVVSRTPIREALRRLAQERLIADTGKGSVVLGITAEDLVDIMDIRCKIEGLASYYAAKNAAPEGLARLQHILDLQEFYFEKRDAEHLREMDDQFHDIICDMSGHAVISDTLVPLHRKRMIF